MQMDSVRFIVGASEVMVRFYDLKDPVSSSKGLRRLKNHMSKMEKDKVRVIICGGDGTVGWVLSVLEDAKIKVEELIFGIFPLGTGNDFARVLNWGPGEEGDIVGPKLGRLKKLVENWVSADVIQFDVWHVKVTVHEVIRNPLRMAISRKSRGRSRLPWTNNSSPATSPTTAGSAWTVRSATTSTRTGQSPRP